MLFAENLCKSYSSGKEEVKALDSVSCSIRRGSMNFIVGPSGSGKSTFLRILGLLDHPTSGKLIFMDREVSSLSDNETADFRSKHIGYVFQSFNLIPVLSVEENVSLPLYLHPKYRHKQSQMVKEVLNRVGLTGLERRGIHEISGGQCQRVAIARALITQPDLIVADEPTANLDSKTSLEIMALIHDLNKQSDTTFLICTHNEKIISPQSQIFIMNDGHLAVWEVS